ncbi:MAG: chloride channel protein [Fibrobacterota bacterium]|nr:chloride channel protein [Fibrobacterota bacterium]QQS07327.1 MAG: chloride channel protein [Fibrobacterota bacterium]
MALCLVALLSGSASALFLWLLESVTMLREGHGWLLYFLPLAGLVSGLAYHRFGAEVEAGNNRILQELHDPKTFIPLRMAPMVLLGTLATHLFGGSAGREGTAIQMGGALSDQVAKWMRFSEDVRKMLLLAGVAGGFSSLFGTPLAGAVFALEFVVVGHLRLVHLLPCVLAAVAADRICLAWGAQHAIYPVSLVPPLDARGFLLALVAGVAFGLAARGFVELSHAVSDRTKAWISKPWLRPALGGILVVGCLLLAGTRYEGLGLPVIAQSFREPVLPWDFALKLALTALTVGVGFKGGEVTPLFFVGATLGSALSVALGLPAPLLAGMGLVAVFGAAANTPLACTIMAMELFGAQIGPWAAIACVSAMIVSGKRGIYTAQRHAA